MTYHDIISFSTLAFKTHKKHGSMDLFPVFFWQTCTTTSHGLQQCCIHPTNKTSHGALGIKSNLKHQHLQNCRNHLHGLHFLVCFFSSQTPIGLMTDGLVWWQTPCYPAVHTKKRITGFVRRHVHPQFSSGIDGSKSIPPGGLADWPVLRLADQNKASVLRA